MGTCTSDESPDEPLELPRRTVGWLTGAEHRECESRTGDCSEGSGPSRAVLAAAARANRAITDSASVPAMHVAALVDVSWPASGRNAYDRSIYYLRTAGNLLPDARRRSVALSDLAAAFLARADRTGSARDVLEAVDAAAGAIELDSTNAAAHFNLALSLQRFGLRDVALRQWQRAQTVTIARGWRREARARAEAHRASLPTRALPPARDASDGDLAAFVRASHGTAREHGLRLVLSRWADATAQGDSAGARAWLAHLARLGTQLERAGGDPMLDREAAHLRGPRSRDEAQQRRVARAYGSLTSAHGLLRDGEYVGARREAERIDTLALSTHARLWRLNILAAALGSEGSLRGADSLARSVVARAPSDGTPALAAQALGIRAASLLRQGLYARGIEAAIGAQREYARIGEGANVAAMQATEMQGYFGVGDGHRTFDAAHRALLALATSPATAAMHGLLTVCAIESARAGMALAARYILDEDVAATDSVANPVDRAHSRLMRAQHGRGSPAQADLDLQMARALTDSISDPAMQAWLRADVAAAEATRPSSDPVLAAARLDTTIAFFSRPLIPFRVVPALVARARLRLAAGRPELAARDLREAVRVSSSVRSTLPSALQRASLAASMRDAVEALVRVELRAGRATAALRTWNEARESFAPAGTASPAAPHPRLTIALVGDSLVSWLVRGTDVSAAVTPVHADSLRRRVAALGAALELRVPDAEVQADLAWLYDLMVRPHATQLARDARLLVGLDDRIANVPMAALLDTSANEFLLDRHAIVTAHGQHPSAAPASGGDAHALVVTDPAFPQSSYPGLARLRRAAEEGHAVEALLPAPLTLAGDSASVARVAAELPRASLLHFAGHALMDDELPERSQLVLAGTDETGPLTAERIARMDLRRLRLVILSACETARIGSAPNGRGFGGLADGFLVAGAHGVVGSLWRVDDHLASLMAPAVVRAFLRHGDGAAALRAAQLAMRRSTDPAQSSIAAWSSFRFVGR